MPRRLPRNRTAAARVKHTLSEVAKAHDLVAEKFLDQVGANVTVPRQNTREEQRRLERWTRLGLEISTVIDVEGQQRRLLSPHEIGRQLHNLGGAWVLGATRRALSEPDPATTGKAAVSLWLRAVREAVPRGEALGWTVAERREVVGTMALHWHEGIAEDGRSLMASLPVEGESGG